VARGVSPFNAHQSCFRVAELPQMSLFSCIAVRPNHSLNWTALRRRLRAVRSAPISLVR